MQEDQFVPAVPGMKESAGSVNDDGSTAVAGSSTGLEAAILEKLKVDNVSFGELDRIDGFRGKNAIMLGSCSNVVLWPAVSDEAAEILQRLHDAGHFRYQRSSTIPYFIDSSHLPNMPIAKRMRSIRSCIGCRSCCASSRKRKTGHHDFIALICAQQVSHDAEEKPPNL